MRRRPVSFEQAVYGSFPFWNRGYSILARSADCRPEWVSVLKQSCQRFGERPRDAVDARGIFAIPGLAEGAALVVGVFPNGRDDQGRPGALVFHARFIPERAYRKAGGDPFAFAAGLRGDWSAADVDAVLPAGSLTISAASAGSDLPPPQPDDRTPAVLAAPPETVERIARAIVERKRVVIPSPGPIDALARAVWSRLPAHVRKRASLATFAFDNANRFDLVAIPGRRSAGLALSRDPGSLMIDPGGSSEAASTSGGSEPAGCADESSALTSETSVMTHATRPRRLQQMLRMILPSMIAAAAIGCAGGREVTPEAVQSARKAWEKADIQDYDLELRISSPAGRYRSTVRDGKVVKVESIQPDGKLIEAHPGDPRFYSVGGQFTNMLEELAIAKSAEPFGQPRGTKVVMRFDPDSALGYPHWYRRDVFGSGRSVAIDVVKLEPKNETH